MPNCSLKLCLQFLTFDFMLIFAFKIKKKSNLFWLSKQNNQAYFTFQTCLFPHKEIV